MPEIEVFVPTAEYRITEKPLAARIATLAGARIGWLDNLKANAGELLADVATILKSQGIKFEVVTASKEATAAAPGQVIAHLKQCDAVVLAIAD